MKRSRTATQYFVPIVIAAFALAFIGFLASKYFSFGAFDFTSATIAFESLPAGAAVFVDNHAVPASAGSFSHFVAAGDHTILVAQKDRWPWSKSVTLAARDSVTFVPFLLPQYAQVVEISETDPLYVQATKVIATAIPPAKDTPVRSHDGNVELWIEANTVNAAWRGGSPVPAQFCTGANGSCDTPEAVLTPIEKTVTQAQFLGNRHDVILVTLPDGIYAVETDKRGTQNFQPLYSGSNLRFAPATAEYIYVQDGKKVFKVYF